MSQPSSPTPKKEPRLSKDGIYRHGFGLKAEIMGELNEDYHSAIIETIRAAGNTWEAGGLRLRIAEAFGFCYGVDKAIDFAYETKMRFPERRIYLTHEIIHNPRVNRRLQEMGIRILGGQYADGTELSDITAEDVVILPAFGVAAGLLEQLKAIGCILVDTTCGSVVHVWKRVEKYAREGFTALIHGKYAHEETVATCSHVTKYEGGQYIVVRDMAEAERVCEVIRTGRGGEALLADFRNAISAGFDPARHLGRIGVANQTTMLSSESLRIGVKVREALADRHGEDVVSEHFRTFDTICHATQERQDAVLDMMQAPPDLMLVVGGFNSSNTTHLSKIASQYCPTFHVDDVDGLISPGRIRHKPPSMSAEPVEVEDWLPARRPLEIGLTAGASTPNRVIGEVVERLLTWEEAGAPLTP